MTWTFSATLQALQRLGWRIEQQELTSDGQPSLYNHYISERYSGAIYTDIRRAYLSLLPKASTLNVYFRISRIGDGVTVRAMLAMKLSRCLQH